VYSIAYKTYLTQHTMEGFEMDLTWIETLYSTHTGLCNMVILILVFGGMGRVAFWRDHEGLHVGGPLAVGLALLLTVAMLQWARAEHRTIIEFGPWAAFLLAEAVIILGWHAFRKSGRS